jgi:hypothetical protein
VWCVTASPTRCQLTHRGFVGIGVVGGACATNRAHPATRLPQNGCGGVLPPALATKRRGAEPQSAITATDDLSSWERLTNLPALREIPGPTGVCSASMGSATIPREAAWAGPGCQALILDDVQRLAWRRVYGLSCKALAH